MEYSLLKDPLNEERVIQKVYKKIDTKNRILIKWDCLINDENDLIIVVRSDDKAFSLSSFISNTNTSSGTDIFIYSRKDTDAHIEYDRNNKIYSYYIFPGRLLDNGKIGIWEQTDNNNIVEATSKPYSVSNNIQPEGKLYYQYRFQIPLAACICSMVIAWCIYSFFDLQQLPQLQWIEYKYIAIIIILICLICYFIFPAGNWFKRACLHIIGKSKYTDKDVIRYIVSECNEQYSVRLTDTSNDIVIPLKKGEKVYFNSQDINIKNLSLTNYLYWKYIKHKRET